MCAFQYKRDAERFYEGVGERLGKFGLKLAEEKTNIISFSPSRKKGKTKFEFLGFEFRWGVSHRGKNIIKLRTARGKLRKSLAGFKDWCKKMKHQRIRKLFPKLIAKLNGYYNYYGLIGNYRSLYTFYGQAKKILYKALNRRSQRRSFTQDEFDACWERHGVPKPRIVESAQVQLHFEF